MARLPEPWARWRAALGRLHPAYYRLVLDWATLQPTRAPADLAALNLGCMRTVRPCLPYAGLRDQLRALASRQRRGGWVGVAVITGTPAWAAEEPSRCDPPGTLARARPPRPDALPAYRRLVADVLALARREGAELRYWSAWNEPNHPRFLSPPCGESRAAAYTPLARALRAALGGEQRQLVGETAQLRNLPRFIAQLPEDVVCSAPIYAQHAYVGAPDPVDTVARALAARGCPHPIWITETGVGNTPFALSAARRVRQGCAALHRRLVRWWRDPRVPVAFQYTLRNDDLFPTGLVSTDLSHALPELAEWTAWGGARAPSAPPPPAACGATAGPT
ncbi:MAG TPA: hypothetical protein VH418_08605 [Solirubrobacteraceae bacterium]